MFRQQWKHYYTLPLDFHVLVLQIILSTAMYRGDLTSWPAVKCFTLNYPHPLKIDESIGWIQTLQSYMSVSDTDKNNFRIGE